MDRIDITSELERFKTHLENNPRTIFSAKFGDGKTYFLDEYIEMHQSDTLFVVLHPINYSVASNEDVFEYIKRDILVELSKEPDFKEVDWKEVAKTIFDYDTLLEVNTDLADALPEDFIAKPLAKAMLVPFKLFKKIDDKYAIDKYFGRFEEMRGGLFEQDQFTAAIRATVAKIQEKGRKCVLIVEDLDRIDPGHLFRILNVLGAQIDDESDSNKFGLDNIIAVLDYQMTEHIFHHFYGADANYSGYMAKFTGHNIFEYSITREANIKLGNYLQKECHLDARAWSFLWHNDRREGIPTIDEKLTKLSVRDVVNILDDIEEQYVTEPIQVGKYFINPGVPIVKLLAILTRMGIRVDQSRLMEFIHSNTEHYALLGAFILKEPQLIGKRLDIRGRSITVNTHIVDGITSVSFHPLMGGTMESHEPKTPSVLEEIYKCVHDCKPNLYK